MEWPVQQSGVPFLSTGWAEAGSDVVLQVEREGDYLSDFPDGLTVRIPEGCFPR